MTFNVLSGGEERFGSILDRIREARPDLLVLQECVGWEHGGRLTEIAAAMGVPDGAEHAHLGRARPRPSGRRYHVALLSRAPIRAARDHADPRAIGHCLVEARVAMDRREVTVLGAHFDANSEDARLAEVAYLQSLVEPAALARGDFLLLGDLNALSRRDPYPPDLAARVRAAGTDKYGHPPRFDVVDALERMGWVDALRARPSSGAWVTAERDRNGVHIDYRTDYVFVSPALAPGLRGTRVLPAHGASDHNAVVAELDLPASQ